MSGYDKRVTRAKREKEAKPQVQPASLVVDKFSRDAFGNVYSSGPAAFISSETDVVIPDKEEMFDAFYTRREVEEGEAARETQIKTDTEDRKLADRHNKGKKRFSLFPVEVLEACLDVLEFGAKKYAPGQWKKGLLYTACADSLDRHWNLRWKKGFDLDEETGCWELAHVIVNALFLLYYQLKRRHDLDDREK